MVARGEIDPEQAAELLRALERRRARRRASLFNPLEGVAEGRAVQASGLIALAGLALSRFGIRFDGVLDVHLVSGPVPLRVAFLDAVVSWPMLAVLLWIAARLVSRQGRFIDFLSAVGLARLPLVLFGAFVAMFRDALPKHPGDPISSTVLAIVILVSVPTLVWNITWLYRGFRTASGLEGRKLTLTLIAMMVLAELLSKFIV
jgi:hypothetical protein